MHREYFPHCMRSDELVADLKCLAMLAFVHKSQSYLVHVSAMLDIRLM